MKENALNHCHKCQEHFYTAKVPDDNYGQPHLCANL